MLSRTMKAFASKAHEGDELYDKLIKKVNHSSGNLDTDFHYVILIISVLGINTPLEAITKLKDGQICIDKLQEFLSSRLSPRQFEAITLRYGLHDAKIKNLREVGELMGCCGENVRIVEFDGIRKLRHFRNRKLFLLD